jgi:lauroyl/myristoyl acyltransferase
MLSRVLFHAALGVVSRVPRGAGRVLASLIATLEYRLNPARRAAVLGNLAQIARTEHPGLSLPSDRARTARSVFRSYHRFVLEFLGQRRLTPDRWNRTFRFRDMEVLYRAAA